MGVNVQPETFYSPQDVKEIFGFSLHSLNVACRSGDLKFTKRPAKGSFRGQWLIDWLEGMPSSCFIQAARTREAIPA